MEPVRCGWVTSDPLYQEYHDNVWGRPVTDSQTLFAKLCLDGQQAGLSWITILKKQKNYEDLFYQFDPHQIVLLTDQDVERLLQNPGIIRNRLKVNAIITNAKAFIAMEQAGENFSEYIWSFVDGKTRVNQWHSLQDVPASTEQSDAMAKDLKKRGFKFVGTTICYAFMQAVGLVNDHVIDCHCYHEVSRIAK